MKIRQRKHSIKSTKILQWIEKASQKQQQTIHRTVVLQLPHSEAKSPQKYELTQSLRDSLLKNAFHQKKLMSKIQSYSLEVSELQNQNEKVLLECKLSIHLA